MVSTFIATCPSEGVSTLNDRSDCAALNPSLPVGARLTGTGTLVVSEALQGAGIPGPGTIGLAVAELGGGHRPIMAPVPFADLATPGSYPLTFDPIRVPNGGRIVIETERFRLTGGRVSVSVEVELPDGE